jgi:transcriptional regulator with XRE-family HTH domain
MIRKAPISDLLKKARENAGLSQAEVARELGYSSPQFVSNWERGLSSPPVPKLKKLCKMYQLSVDQAYQAMLAATLEEVERKLHSQFYGGGGRARRKSAQA